MKRYLALLLSLAMIFSMIGCTQTGGEAADTTEPETEETQDAPVEEVTGVTYPVTVTDQAGRTVTIEEEPQSIVSGYYISTSLLIALDQKDKLVGIEAKADKLKPIKGLMPDPTVVYEGCAFADRCNYATEKCRTTPPKKHYFSETHFVECCAYDDPEFHIERGYEQ